MESISAIIIQIILKMMDFMKPDVLLFSFDIWVHAACFCLVLLELLRWLEKWTYKDG